MMKLCAKPGPVVWSQCIALPKLGSIGISRNNFRDIAIDRRTRTYHRFTESEQLVESIKELDPDQPIVMLRKSDAQLLLEVSAHKQRPSLCPFKYTNEND